jgi:NADH-quinone oxidoreductase subunit G
MPKLSIDGTEYEVPAGKTILQAIDDMGLLMNGVDIPHYCWHPKLSIDGSCRLCQVEIDGMPKLQIACNTVIADGMKVHTQSERVMAARRGVMELLLINHPLDCPICDQAGECKLQDYAFDYGVAAARTREPRRPAKKAVDLGPTIVFDQERCILCRRCVRFCREVPKTGELGVFNRGDESLLETFPGSELDNPYSMNVADICPVGALTTRDFRFKIRVWFTDDVDSVCNQCARGCNISASRSNNRIYRFVPRRNDQVNDTWMCDHGRMSYKLNDQGRVAKARIGGKPVATTEAIARAAELLRAAHAGKGRIVGVASPMASNEELAAFKDFLVQLGAGAARFAVPHGESDDILIEAEKAPNAAGCRALGMSESADSLGHAELAVVLGHTLHAAAFADVRHVLLIDTHESALSARADVVLPARTFLEKAGTFTNIDGVTQRFAPVVEPTFEALTQDEALAELGRAAGLRA